MSDGQLQAAKATIRTLLWIMGQVEQCHGCLAQSLEAETYRTQLDAAAAFVGMSADERWWA